MAAAVALEAAGWGVTLLESRKTLGGRAGSFEDPKTDEELDNCQHVLLGCCTNLIDFYRRIGAADRIEYHRTIHFLDEQGRWHDLSGIPGTPAPLNLAPSLLQFEALTWGERVALSRGMTAMLRLGRGGKEKLEGTSFGQWLDEQHQPAELVRKFYDPIIISALNEETRAASAAYAIQVFQEAMLANEAGYVMGLPACTLAELYRRIPCADVRVGERVSDVVIADGHVTGVRLSGGETLNADAVVLATNHHAARRLISDDAAAADPRFGGLDRLESVPILGAHLWFDRPVMRHSHAALIGGPLQWLFRKDREGRAVHGVISAARDWVDVPRDEALRQFESQVRSLFHVARDARLVRGVVVIEKRATFSPKPGIHSIRPSQSPSPSGTQNLYLAGDYTQTGWPATMEGAVRSGYLAAQAITGEKFLVPDLPAQWPAKLMGLR
jgi:zeta-carotene desaturase